MFAGPNLLVEREILSIVATFENYFFSAHAAPSAPLDVKSPKSMLTDDPDSMWVIFCHLTMTEKFAAGGIN